MLNGGSIETIVNPRIVLRYVDQDPDAFWNFLFFCGYLKPVDLQLIEGRYHAKLAIPNKEVRIVYQDLFQRTSGSVRERSCGVGDGGWGWFGEVDDGPVMGRDVDLVSSQVCRPERPTRFLGPLGGSRV